MKKRRVDFYRILVILFGVVMIGLLLFFKVYYEDILIKNETNKLLERLYKMDSGEYELINGSLISGNKHYGSYINASGNITIDKYKNVSFVLFNKNRCISKTPMGNISVSSYCSSPYKIQVKMNKNNNKISFVSNVKNLEYKISNKDDFKGVWNKDDYKDNIVIKSYNEGTNYIWFKDSDGNISDPVTFEIDCLQTSKSVYDKHVFYCSGSTVKVDNIDFVVIEDKNTYIKLMKFSPIDEELSMCTNSISNYCYYEKNMKNVYNWTNSYVNYYLNNNFINNLSNETKSHLIESEICDDVISRCDNELCIGMSREEIDKNEYMCNSYSKTKIKLISYDEYNYVYRRTKFTNILNGSYLAINSFSIDKGTSIQYDGSFYIEEDLLKSKDIKPVIILSK